MVDNRPYTGYGSQSSKHPPVRYTVPVLRCRTYGSYGLRLTPLRTSSAHTAIWFIRTLGSFYADHVSRWFLFWDEVSCWTFACSIGWSVYFSIASSSFSFVTVCALFQRCYPLPPFVKYITLFYRIHLNAPKFEYVVSWPHLFNSLVRFLSGRITYVCLDVGNNTWQGLYEFLRNSTMDGLFPTVRAMNNQISKESNNVNGGPCTICGLLSLCYAA